MPEVIFDNCVLSNFSLSGSFDLIRKLYDQQAFVTDFVAAENRKGIMRYAALSIVRDAIRNGWLNEVFLNTSFEKSLFDSLSISMGLGEASSIAIAKSRAMVFACDDRAARREAGLLGVTLTGTLGILIKAVRTKIITAKEADEILSLMVRHGFYSPVQSLREML